MRHHSPIILFLAITAISACNAKGSNEAHEADLNFGEAPPSSWMDNYSQLECTMLNSNYSGDDLQAEVDYYEGLSEEEAEVIVAFYREGEPDPYYPLSNEIIVRSSGFSIVSSELDDNGNDIYGNPLNTTVFSIAFSAMTLIEASAGDFFDEEGQMHLEDGEDVWLHVLSNSGNSESLNMMLTAYDWENDFGRCRLVK